jgi:TonB family protein
LEVSRPGFATLMEDVAIAASVARDLRLRVGSLEETVTVRASTPLSSARDASTVTQLAEDSRRLLAERARAKCASGAPGLIGGQILPPAKLVDVKPSYPAHLRAAKVGGVVTMQARIATDGTVLEVRAVEGPHPDLEVAAADAVRQWQFSTTYLNCEPIEVEMKVTTNFAVEP